jgi:hypothetical protein
MAELSSGNLWGIACYFNPAGYRRRLENYRLFRRHLTIPLVTVELSFGGDFQLQREDAEVLVQIRGGDVLWQKERLLNIAMKRVPETCDKIAWLDCDVVFVDRDWAERASRALDDVLLLHLFDGCHDLPRDVTIGNVVSDALPEAARSMVYRMTVEGVPAEDLLLRHPRGKRQSTNGLAWASRREVLEEHGLYDACILGSGDRAILSAALGKFHCCTRGLLMNARQESHYLAWARPYFETVRGRVGYIAGRVCHLWHGDMKDRQYGERDRALEAFGFDPFRDIALGKSGCWRWGSDKWELHSFVKRYFKSRNEDGV